MRDVEVHFDGFDAYDVEPPALPDLFASRPIVVFGKYRSDGPLPEAATIKVTGRVPGEEVELEVKVADADLSEENAALRYLWARQRLRRISDLRFVRSADRAEVVELGLRYNLLTDHTAYVAVDTEVRAEEPALKVIQPQPLPAGVSSAALPSGGKRSVTLHSFSGCRASGYGSLGLRGYGSGGGGVGSSSFSLSGGGVAYGSGVGGVGGIQLGARAKGVSRMVPGRTVILGSLSRDEIKQEITRRQNQLRYCYQRQLISDPGLYGKVVVHFIIQPDGRVTGARVDRSSLGNDKVEACLLRIFGQLRFPSVPGGGVVEVSYPLIFAPVSP